MSRILGPNGFRSILALAVVLTSVPGWPGSAEARTETLQWIDQSPARVPVDGFRIYVRDAGQGWGAPSYDDLPLASGGVYSASIEVVPDDRTVEIAVQAYNAFGPSPLSNTRVRSYVAPSPDPDPEPTPDPDPEPTPDPDPEPTPDPDPLPTVQAPFRVNAGGSAYTDPEDNTWVPDDPYRDMGESNTRWGSPDQSLEIGGTDKDPLYRTESYLPGNESGPMSYAFPIENGVYIVRLHEAEIWDGITGPGQRVFDVRVEGQLVLDDYDPFAQVGYASADVQEFAVTVSDGVLDIEFLRGVQNPCLSAIEILPPDAPPAPSPATLGTPGKPILVE